jgi:hypothetical protein
VSLPVEKRQAGLTIPNRYPRWMQRYPQDFWQPWHMSLLGHGMIPRQESTALMETLYRTDTQKTAAATALISFEARTILGHLPPTTGANEALLQEFVEDLEGATDVRPFWTTLNDHFNKHVTLGSSGPALRAASSACMHYLTGLTGLSMAEHAEVDPGEVDTPERYARLARLITLLSVTPERHFEFSLYCASDQTLALNIRVPPSFLTDQGEQADREVLVGLTLATADQVPGPGGGVAVPMLVPELYFSTLFAPTPREGKRMYGDGRSCHLNL